MSPHRPFRILTWHVHGNYLFYLTQVPHTFVLPVNRERTPPYCGRSGTLPWGPNVVEVPVEDLPKFEVDCVLYQSPDAWQRDRHELLSEQQRRVPQIYLEHDPPQQHPTNTRHPVDDPDALLVHVSAFNRLMWDNGATPTAVIEHGVKLLRAATYSGEIPRAIAVVNHIARRGRRLGADVFETCRRSVPLDLVGMESERANGLGEIPNAELPGFLARYRLYFHPVRWTSLGLSVIEAMMVGLPVVGLATTELVTVIENGKSGYIDTEPVRLCAAMNRLLERPLEARALGANAKQVAEERFGIDRFIDDWLRVLRGTQ